jgi:diguanylate cyclase (GGDEF)-like protein/PAS domain S-box-containing protein
VDGCRSFLLVPVYRKEAPSVRHDSFLRNQSEQRCRELFNHSKDAILLSQFNEPFHFLEVNSLACHWLGYTREELLLQSVMNIPDPSHTLVVRRMRRKLQKESRLTFESTYISKNGDRLFVEIDCQVMDIDGERVVLTSARDLSERKNMEQRIRESEQIFHSLFMHNPNAIGVFNMGGELVKFNPTASHLLGYTGQELLGRHYSSFFAEKCLLDCEEFLDRNRKGESQAWDTVLLHKEGYRIDVHITTFPTYIEDKLGGYIIICQDISERKRNDERFRHLAYYDDRTGLPNRQMFKERLTTAIEEARQHSGKIGVFYLDIDRFKLINDSLGRDFGDMLLMQVAERFTHCVSDNDFLARTEGDEFAFYFKGIVFPNDLLKTAERISVILEQPFIMGEYSLHISASIGISLFTPDEPFDADTLMKYADIALSKAKNKGKNNFQVFNEDMQKVSMTMLLLENDLRQAIERNEFTLYYQPQIEIENGKIVGLEALIRWNHPVRGLVSPKDFIPVAEDSGLIVPIGEWVLNEACKQNKQWQDAGLAYVPVSVNLSTRQFLQYNLLEIIAGILESTGLEPQYLELEITESMTMDVDYAISCLLELKKLGVQISIDDFGTGYSSLHYLKKFPIDKLKIDQSFVRDIMIDPNDAAIVSTIIAMTHHLKLKVIAEGVETKEQLQFLHDNHCNQVQGYWFSPPIPVLQVEAILKLNQEIMEMKDWNT